MKTTTEFSFVLKPSTVKDAGIGVFATHDMDKDVRLALHTEHHESRKLQESDIPKDLLDLCIAEKGGWYICPPEFNRVEVGWYVNHSDKPNATKRNSGVYSTQPIKAGDEIFMNYNQMHEPKSKKEEFYT